MELAVEQICGDQSGVEIHRHHQQEGEDAASAKSLPGERICGAGAGYHTKECEHQCDHDTVTHGICQGTIPEHSLIRLKCQILRDEEHIFGHYRRIPGDGFRAEMDKWKHTGKTQDSDEDHDDDITYVPFIDRPAAIGRYDLFRISSMS